MCSAFIDQIGTRFSFADSVEFSYMQHANMGHGSKILSSTTQNLFFEKALLWLGSQR